MAKIIQAVVSALALGVCSTAIYAGGSSPSVPNKWNSCTEVGCSKDIPITLTVKKKCVVTAPQGITLTSNGVGASQSYQVRANTHYVLDLSTENAAKSNNTFVKNSNGQTIDTVITTAYLGSGGPAAPTFTGPNNYAGLVEDKFTVTAKTKVALDDWQAAGTYTDQYKIRVLY
ncbi:hypothetical protein GHJ48_13120 [Acinetobacter sp. dk771]|uniref:Spore coat protein U domain-containing protein n=1 Tax=Acinetobacter wanghuae TaxID=2662362 RepID=A0AA91AGQ8_9GAMM|nr:hypothetical protein [Acinetobacter wanghuae]MQW93316.1 hypothetical protein [Acinetobacter wanghuae]